jgi:vacuolar-type H+-ATPase subunit I/STV1
MTTAVAARASTEPTGSLGDPPVTLHETIMGIAEHLKEAGEFNDRAYVAMCNVAKEAHSMRDDVMLNLDKQLTIYKTKNSSLNSYVANLEEAVEQKRKIIELYKAKIETLEEVHKTDLELCNTRLHLKACAKKGLVGAVTKAPTRKLRSGRRF